MAPDAATVDVAAGDSALVDKENMRPPSHPVPKLATHNPPRVALGAGDGCCTFGEAGMATGSPTAASSSPSASVTALPAATRTVSPTRPQQRQRTHAAPAHSAGLSASLVLPRSATVYEQSLQQLGAALESTLSLFAEVKHVENEVRLSKSMGAPGSAAAEAVGDEAELASLLSKFNDTFSKIQQKVASSTGAAACAPAELPHLQQCLRPSSSVSSMFGATTASASFASDGQIEVSSLLEHYSDLVVQKLLAKQQQQQ